MRLSKFLQKSIKDIKTEDISKNAQLLTKAGFVNCLMSGVYVFFPMGLRVINNIENIVKDEMNKIGAQEMFMPSLTPKSLWETSGRINTIDVLFNLKGCNSKELVLCPTHEEVITPTIKNFVRSYKDLPLYVYQIQTKFRNELRAKSGLLRGREFKMKDLYSFHTTEEDLDSFYQKVIEAYKNIFRRCGIANKTILTYASGGVFSKWSHEFQTITDAGEDIIYKINDDFAVNEEVIDEVVRNKEFGITDKNNLTKLKSIETGNIFKLGIKYAKDFNVQYTDQDGSLKYPLMGCYGIGISRLMGTIVECLADDKGLVWPKEVAPFKVCLVNLDRSEIGINKSDEIYNLLLDNDIDVLYDDRLNIGNGEKLKDADLFGIPVRLIVSQKTLNNDGIAYKERTSTEEVILSLENVLNKLKNI